MLNVGKNAEKRNYMFSYIIGMFDWVIQNHMQKQKQYLKLTLVYIKFSPTSVGLFFAC
jgi:hypothetical protein